MREVYIRLEKDELEEFRRLDMYVRAAESSPSDMTMDRSLGIYEAMLNWWISLHRKYDLEDEETYEVNPIAGVVYVDKD